MCVVFAARIERGTTKDTVGLVVPLEVLEALGRGKRPPVTVTLGDYSYRSTLGSMGGQFMIGVSSEHRQQVKLDGLDAVEVTLALDEAPRMSPAPDDLLVALRAAGKLEAFDAAAPSRRKEFVRQVESAKAEATRARRIEKVVAELAGDV